MTIRLTSFFGEVHCTTVENEKKCEDVKNEHEAIIENGGSLPRCAILRVALRCSRYALWNVR